MALAQSALTRAPLPKVLLAAPTMPPLSTATMAAPASHPPLKGSHHQHEQRPSRAARLFQWKKARFPATTCHGSDDPSGSLLAPQIVIWNGRVRAVGWQPRPFPTTPCPRHHPHSRRPKYYPPVRLRLFPPGQDCLLCFLMKGPCRHLKGEFWTASPTILWMLCPSTLRAKIGFFGKRLARRPTSNISNSTGTLPTTPCICGRRERPFVSNVLPPQQRHPDRRRQN